jgi:phosphate transport system substrate-binding protein
MMRARPILRFAGSTLALVSVSLAEVAAQSAPIKLKLRDGDFVVQGALVSFDGKTFVIDDRAYGRMTFEAARFACVDGPCPAAPPETALPQAPPRPENEDVRVVLRGSNSIAATLAPALIRSFAQQNGQATTRVLGQSPMQVDLKLARAPQKAPATFAIEPQSAGAGIEGLAKGEADLAMADRPVNDAEARSLAPLTSDARGALSEHVIALDAIVVAVHPSRARQVLSVAEVQGILSGAIKDWSELKGEPGPIELIVPSLSSSAMEQVRRILLQPANKTLSPEAKAHSAVNTVADVVARSPNAIGITSRSASDNVATVALRGACGLDATPTEHAIKTADYPLTRKLFLYSAQAPRTDAAAKLLAFAKSEVAQTVVTDERLVNLTISVIADDAHGPRFEHAARLAASLKREADWLAHRRDLTGAQRLTATFRFPSGRSEMDAKSDQDLSRLSAYLAEPRFQGREILIVGYADSVGRYDLNVTLAANRAQKVRAALIQRGGPALQGRTLTARGHGPHAPVVCNDDAAAHDINRRVEIWVRN